MDSTRDGLASDSESSGFYIINSRPPDFLEANSRYRLLEELGRGGMGIVYRASDLDLHRDVAIKILIGEYADSCIATNQFINEARIMGMLQHPGIAQVYERGTLVDGRPFHAMKLVQGKTLGQLFSDRDGPSGPSAKLLNIYAIVCQAMAYTHSQDVVHLDLKPNNIMVGEFGEVHVMDWGLAKTISDTKNAEAKTFHLSHDNDLHPRRNGVQGTLHYMSPEQANGHPVDKRTDVFCLGALLCEILTGQPPYTATSKKAAMRDAKQGALEPAIRRLESCRSETELVRLAKRCLQPSPDERPANAVELANEMSRYSESALKLLRDDMSRFFELSLDLFCIAGFDGFFRRINSNFSLVLGFSDEELLAQPFLNFVHPDDQVSTIKVMGKLLDGKSVVRFRNRYVTKTGESLEFEWTAKSIVAENVIFAVARNVSSEIESSLTF